MKTTARVFAITAVVAATIAAVNYFMLHKPVTDRMAADSRNSGISLLIHYKYGIVPGTVIFDLRTIAGSKAPLDLWRVFFQGASVLATMGRSPANVQLQRSGNTVFVLKGEDFLKLGAEFENGQNPVFLLRTLPEKLANADGTAAYQAWTGGLLGVVGKQMEDLSDAGRRWVGDPAIER